jgi:serine/threonine protein kinase
MGRVWRAHDSQTNRVVALKVLPERSADDEMLRERFRRECRAVAQLTDPHVIPIHDFGDLDGRLFLNMRLIDGDDLRSVIRSEGALPPQRAVAIVGQVAAALQSVHDAGLVHRDVKPSNILLGADDFAYLIDFGIAHATDDHTLTSAGATIGTFDYLAPEAIGTEVRTDARMDVYALACVLYECLTGRPPFSNASGMKGLIANHLHTPPPRPSASEADVAAAFDAVVAKGMAKDPDDRYQSARELAVAAAVGVTVWTSRDASDRGHPVAASPTASATSAAPAPAPAPDNPNNLSADEIDLLKLAWNGAYNRASCHHVDTVGLAKAVITCDANPSTGAPDATFTSFVSPDQLHAFFSNYTSLVNATNCPGDPPGLDGPAKQPGGKVVGRRACYPGVGRDPLPSTTVTHEPTPVMADFHWSGQGGDGLYQFVYADATDGGLPDQPSDPDFFTPADLDLLSRFSGAFRSMASYTTANCRHIDPPNGTKVQLYCSSNPRTGYPNVSVVGAELGTLRAAFDLSQRQHGSGCTPGSAPANEAWVLDGHEVGRYTCLTEAASGTPVAAIEATNEDRLWAAEFQADDERFPYPVPRNAKELLAWFTDASA